MMKSTIDRRKFNQTLATLLAATTLPTLPVWAQGKKRNVIIGHTGITWPGRPPGRRGGGGAPGAAPGSAAPGAAAAPGNAAPQGGGAPAAPAAPAAAAAPAPPVPQGAGRRGGG